VASRRQDAADDSDVVSKKKHTVRQLFDYNINKILQKINLQKETRDKYLSHPARREIDSAVFDEVENHVDM